MAIPRRIQHGEHVRGLAGCKAGAVHRRGPGKAGQFVAVRLRRSIDRCGVDGALVGVRIEHDAEAGLLGVAGTQRHQHVVDAVSQLAVLDIGRNQRIAVVPAREIVTRGNRHIARIQVGLVEQALHRSEHRSAAHIGDLFARGVVARAVRLVFDRPITLAGDEVRHERGIAGYQQAGVGRVGRDA